MKHPILIILILILLYNGQSYAQPTTKEQTINLKCLIQLKNYDGHGAYFVVSLLNSQGKYVRTLYVQGTNYQWYPHLVQWWNNIGKKNVDIDAISSATNGSGARTICKVNLKKEEIDSGYRIRFETVVQDQTYHPKDLEFILTKENLKKQLQGNGYIRYVRFISQ